MPSPIPIVRLPQRKPGVGHWRTHEGTGIGLALVQELVSLHGGTVRVESKENRGTTFTVALRAGTAHLPSERVSAGRGLASTTARAADYANEALHWLPNAAPPC